MSRFKDLEQGQEFEHLFPRSVPCRREMPDRVRCPLVRRKITKPTSAPSSPLTGKRAPTVDPYTEYLLSPRILDEFITSASAKLASLVLKSIPKQAGDFWVNHLVIDSWVKQRKSFVLTCHKMRRSHGLSYLSKGLSCERLQPVQRM